MAGKNKQSMFRNGLVKSVFNSPKWFRCLQTIYLSWTQKLFFLCELSFIMRINIPGTVFIFYPFCTRFKAYSLEKMFMYMRVVVNWRSVRSIWHNNTHISTNETKKIAVIYICVEPTLRKQSKFLKVKEFFILSFSWIYPHFYLSRSWNVRGTKWNCKTSRREKISWRCLDMTRNFIICDVDGNLISRWSCYCKYRIKENLVNEMKLNGLKVTLQSLLGSVLWWVLPSFRTVDL